MSMRVSDTLLSIIDDTGHLYLCIVNVNAHHKLCRVHLVYILTKGMRQLIYNVQWRLICSYGILVRSVVLFLLFALCTFAF